MTVLGEYEHIRSIEAAPQVCLLVLKNQWSTPVVCAGDRSDTKGTLSRELRFDEGRMEVELALSERERDVPTKAFSMAPFLISHEEKLQLYHSSSLY